MNMAAICMNQFHFTKPLLGINLLWGWLRKFPLLTHLDQIEHRAAKQILSIISHKICKSGIAKIDGSVCPQHKQPLPHVAHNLASKILLVL